jgi:hypothetical protein
MTTPALKDYMCKKYAWGDEEFDEVDWQSHGRALKRLEKHRKTLVQFLHDWTPVGKTVNRYGIQYLASYPSCHTPVEDRDHLWHCPAASRSTWRRKCYSALLKTLNDLDTAPAIQELLLVALKTLLDNRLVTTIRMEPGVAHIGRAQANIGWHHILKGRLSKKWREAQDKYLGQRAKKSNNGSTWMTKLIEVILQ